MSALAPVVRFEIVRRLRWRPLAWLMVAHPVVAAAAYVVPTGPGPPLGSDVAMMGMQIVWLFLVSFELGRDRELGMDALMTSNLVGPGTYVLAKIVALGCVLVAYHAAVLLVVATLAPGGLGEARQAAGMIGLLLPLIPLALSTELLVPTRAPLIYVVVAGSASLLIAFWSGVDATTIAAWLGLEAESVFAVRPAILGVAGLIAVSPIAARRAAGDPPF